MKRKFWSIMVIVCCVVLLTATDYSNSNRTSHIGSIFSHAISNLMSSFSWDLDECGQVNLKGDRSYSCEFGHIPSDFQPGSNKFAVSYPDGTVVISNPIYRNGWSIKAAGWNVGAVSSMYRARFG